MSAAAADLVLVGPMARLFDMIFPDRIHRVDFVVRFVILTVLTDILVVHSPMPTSTADAFLMILWWLAAFLVGVYYLFFVFLPRLRDAAMSAWWLLLGMFPLLNLPLAAVLALRPTSTDIRATERVDLFWT